MASPEAGLAPEWAVERFPAARKEGALVVEALVLVRPCLWAREEYPAGAVSAATIWDQAQALVGRADSMDAPDSAW